MTNTDEGFEIALVVKGKHAALWRACKQFGSQAAFARHLGVTQMQMSAWINLKQLPSKEARAQIEKKIVAATGRHWDDLFPSTILTDAFLSRAKSIEMNLRFVRQHAVAMIGDDAPELNRDAVANAILSALATLSDNERKVVEYRYGFADGKQHTLHSASKALGISPTGISTIELRAIQKLQCKTRIELFSDAVPDQWYERALRIPLDKPKRPTEPISA